MPEGCRGLFVPTRISPRQFHTLCGVEPDSQLWYNLNHCPTWCT